MKKSDEATIGLHLLLAELLHREIDASLRELLLQPDILEVFSRIEPQCQNYLTREWTESDYEQAAVEFCDLFILPDTEKASDSITAAPRAAAWLSIGGSITPEAIDTVISQFISEWNIQVPPGYQQLAYDHASLILYLSAAIRKSSPEQADEFDAATLHSWIPAFGTALSKTSNPIYKTVGLLLKDMTPKHRSSF